MRGKTPTTLASKGFSLVELAVVLTVAGVLFGAAAGLLRPYYDEYRYNMTRAKLDRLSDALANFAQIYNRLPCPALAVPPTEPFGAPANSGAAGTDYTQHCGFTAADYNGIVPFRALGLGEEDARDAYGNFITYQVTAELAGGLDAGKVHEYCRTPVWVANGMNKNAAKAAFCCPNVLTDNPMTAKVFDRLNAGTRQRMFTNAACPNLPGNPCWDDPDTVFTNVPRGDNEVIAFSLVSHGKNGDNAYVRGSNTRRPVTASATSEESNNGTNSSNGNVMRPLSTSDDTNYFDDIVVWRTNTQLMTVNGGPGCARP